MSLFGRRVPVPAIAAAALLMLLAAMLPALSSTPAREITLVARGMAFYLADDPATPNPEIVVRAGERIRVVLRNDARGMAHDFAVPAASAVLRPIQWSESDDVVFDAPDAPGAYAYECRPHRLMMRGTLRVR
ncbi:MAG: hypothetical protein A3F70_05905 [Acidobacteria bacterium RIFCSPLOWO2_12_FULL_67_14]|nr:MAG: hypothetical protein A3H29_13405 [Acidobacteria bacterium RIFCSPLOWO2_02_FULL_67_21]OFW41141.1 MAG: hypothetical protein A3F70_05905 [Acidobacteria bacterium RIFCSPLOWO2_12_FULL_67_14]